MAFDVIRHGPQPLGRVPGVAQGAIEVMAQQGADASSVVTVVNMAPLPVSHVFGADGASIALRLNHRREIVWIKRVRAFEMAQRESDSIGWIGNLLGRSAAFLAMRV
jgi:hypothetical protein